MPSRQMGMPICRLGIFVGLEFEERMRGKRPVRALRRGVLPGTVG